MTSVTDLDHALRQLKNSQIYYPPRVPWDRFKQTGPTSAANATPTHSPADRCLHYDMTSRASTNQVADCRLKIAARRGCYGAAAAVTVDKGTVNGVCVDSV